MIRFASLLLCAVFLAGCATAKNPADPLEPFNRRVYEFNEGFDKVIVEPTARVYRSVLPGILRGGVSNFFSNLRDIRVTLNNLAQGKLETAASDFSRIVINSSIGLLGFFDVASEAGIERHDEDFGQTLGWYGVRDGPFLMLPFVGPSTTRDLVAWPADIYVDPVILVDPAGAQYALRGTRAVSRRAEALDADAFLKSGLDPYEFLRDAYLQRRRNLLYDGKPPPEGDFTPPFKHVRAAEKPRSARKWMQ